MSHMKPQGFLAFPPTGTGPGVLVLHAWWGLNDTTKAFCSRLAEAGFVAFAPDLYHGTVTDKIEEAEALVQALFNNREEASSEVTAAAGYLSEREETVGDSLAVIGFSLGASYALDLAEAAPGQIHSVVLFYGTGGSDFGHSKAAYLGHFAGDDPFEPRPYVDELESSLKQAGRPVTFYHYDGLGHWFFEPDRHDAYNQAAADLAWDRTLAFLKRFSSGPAT